MIDWKGHRWLQNERWGLIHPEKPHWWYDATSSFIDDNNFLNLLTKKIQDISTRPEKYPK